jgi:F-type H+-transporting ATPase subunit b
MFGAVAVLAASEGGGFNPFEFVPGAAVWTWIIFLAALPLLWKLIFKPITQALDARDQRVEDAIKAADEARARTEEAMRASKAELDTARAEARRMVEEAIGRAQRQGQEALVAARAEAQREREKAREEIDAEKRKALLEIRGEVVKLTMLATSRLLQRQVDDEAQRRLVGEFLETVGPGKGQRN